MLVNVQIIVAKTFMIKIGQFVMLNVQYIIQKVSEIIQKFIIVKTNVKHNISLEQETDHKNNINVNKLVNK